jgi:hypothetical protein
MNKKITKKLIIRILPYLLIIGFFAFLIPFGLDDRTSDYEELSDIERIKNKGVLRATTNSNSTN